MRKRILSFLLALVMVLGMIPAMAPAASAASGFDWVQIRLMEDYPDGYYDEYGHFTSQKPYDYDYDYSRYMHYSDGVLTLHNCHGRLLTCDSVEGLDSLTIVLEGDNSFTQILSDIPVVIKGTGTLTLTMHITTLSNGFKAPGLTIQGGMVKGDKLEINKSNSGITIDGGALEAKTLDLYSKSFIDLEAGNLTLANNRYDFVFKAKQLWQAHRVIFDIYDSYWTWLDKYIPDLKTNDGVESRYWCITDDDDRNVNPNMQKGVPPSGTRRGLLVEWYAYDLTRMTSYPEMPKGKKSTDVVVTTDAYEFSMNAIPLTSGWVDYGFRQSETMIVTDSDGNEIFSRTRDDADASATPITYNMEGLPAGKYKVQMTVRFYDSNDKEKKSLTYTYNVDRQLSSILAIGGYVPAGTVVYAKVYKARTDECVAEERIVTENSDEAFMAFFTDLEPGKYDVKFKSTGYLDAVGTVEVGPKELGSIALEMVKIPLSFRSMNPYASVEEREKGLTDLGTVQLGSAETDIDFYGFPNKLDQEFTIKGWVAGRSITVTKDGKEFYKRTYEENEAFGWNLKENIDDGGTYRIKLVAFVKNGSNVSEISHTFQIKVEGSNIRSVNVDGIGTPVIGKAPSTINTATTDAAGAYIDKVVWAYYSNEMGGSWINMPAGKVFEAGKRYMAIVEMEHEDGYSFALDRGDMYGSINGNKAIVSPVYSTDELALELEYTPVTTPAFTTQPQSTEAPEGGSGFVNWMLNFEPSKLEILRYDGDRPSYNYETLNVRTRSAQVEPSTDAYCIRAYYNDKDYVDSAKFHVYKMNPEAPFTDVKEGDFFYDPVLWALENGITTGTGDGTTFEPNTPCTRGQVVTFLWRAAGKPEPTNAKNPFKDVKTSDYFYKAVLWAKEKNITSGTGDGTTFEPNATCTRGQIVTFLSRAKNGQPTTTKNPFKDVAANAFYYNPVLWAVENKITTGTGDGTTFEPNANCTRGQVVTFLYRAFVK